MATKPSFIWLDSVDSTNNEILRRIGDLDNLSVIAAVRQTAGKGQRGNAWSSEPGANLTFSMLLRFGDGGFAELSAVRQFAISQAVTLGLVDFLRDEGIDARIKWPNDIYVMNRKMTGILIENSLSGAFVKTSVIGIGINCNQRIFPPFLPNPTSMILSNGKFYDNLPQLLEKAVNAMIPYFGMMSGDGAEGLSGLRSRYNGKLFRYGQFHDFTDCRGASAVFRGRICGVSDAGLLKVERENGEVNEFAFKEISFII